jgi:hypothetical protein
MVMNECSEDDESFYTVITSYKVIFESRNNGVIIFFLDLLILYYNIRNVYDIILFI